jgi:thymidylate kinase
LSLILEFIGLSGAGKSTVAEALLSRLRLQGYTCVHRHDIGGQAVPRPLHFSRLAAYFIRHPALLSGSLHLGRSAPRLTLSGFREAIRFYVWSYRVALGRKLGPDIVVLDQGIIQEGWGLVVRQTGLEPSAIAQATKEIVRGARMTYALIYFDVDRDLAARRIAARTAGESRFDAMDQVAAQRLLEVHEPLLKELFRDVAETAGLPVLRVDARASVGALLDELVGFIEKLPVHRQPTSIVAR